jgi:hypothetical protein
MCVQNDEVRVVRSTFLLKLLDQVVSDGRATSEDNEEEVGQALEDRYDDYDDDDDSLPFLDDDAVEKYGERDLKEGYSDDVEILSGEGPL